MKMKLKIISLLIVIVFTINSIVWAQPDFGKRLRTIDTRVGRVVSDYLADSDQKQQPMVILVHDAHDSFDAQVNIGEILKKVDQEYGLENAVVGVEGAVGTINYEYLRQFPLSEARYEAALSLMNKGLLTGAETLAIASEKAIHMVGVEDEKLLFKNYSQYLSLKQDPSLETVLENVEKKYNSLIEESLNEKLYRFIDACRNFKKGFLSVEDFIELLDGEIKLLEIDHTDYIQFTLLKEIAALAASIDSKTLDSEYEAFITKEKSLIENIKIKSKEEGRNVIHSVLKANPDVAQKYPMIVKDVHIAHKHTLVDRFKLLQEINELAQKVIDVSISDADTKRLVEIGALLKLLINMVSINATVEEVEEFIRYEKEYDDTVLAIDRVFKENNISYDFTVLSKAIAIAKAFYQTAEERNHALLENLLNESREENRNIAILVAGGYHASGLKNELRKRNISYVELSPHINDLNKRVGYESRLLGSSLSPNSYIASTVIPRHFTMLMQEIKDDDILQQEFMRAFQPAWQEAVGAEPNRLERLKIVLSAQEIINSRNNEIEKLRFLSQELTRELIHEGINPSKINESVWKSVCEKYDVRERLYKIFNVNIPSGTTCHFSMHSSWNMLENRELGPNYVYVDGALINFERESKLGAFPKHAEVYISKEKCRIFIRGAKNEYAQLVATYLSRNIDVIEDAMQRSEQLYSSHIDENITIILADKYNYPSGDNQDNSTIILNASDVASMIYRKENPKFIKEFVTICLAEELAHERGAQGDRATEIALAKSCADLTFNRFDSNAELIEYINFISRYAESIEGMPDYRYQLLGKTKIQSPVGKIDGYEIKEDDVEVHIDPIIIEILEAQGNESTTFTDNVRDIVRYYISGFRKEIIALGAPAVKGMNVVLTFDHGQSLEYVLGDNTLFIPINLFSNVSIREQVQRAIFVDGNIYDEEKSEQMEVIVNIAKTLRNNLSSRYENTFYTVLSHYFPESIVKINESLKVLKKLNQYCAVDENGKLLDVIKMEIALYSIAEAIATLQHPDQAKEYGIASSLDSYQISLELFRQQIERGEEAVTENDITVVETTVDHAITFIGEGLHSGDEVRLTIRPAEPGSGIVFVLPDGTEVQADAEHAVVSERKTALVADNGKAVITPEHFLGALHFARMERYYTDKTFMRINLRVELRGGNELPSLGGDFHNYYETLRQVLDTDERVEPISIPQLRLNHPTLMRIKEPYGTICFLALPGDETMSLQTLSDYKPKEYGSQFAQMIVSNKDDAVRYRDMMKAMTFVEGEQYHQLRNESSDAHNGKGLYRGARPDVNIVLMSSEKPYTRMATHRCMDNFADLGLVPQTAATQSHFFIFRGGHQHSQYFAKLLDRYIEDTYALRNKIQETFVIDEIKSFERIKGTPHYLIRTKNKEYVLRSMSDDAERAEARVNKALLLQTIGLPTNRIIRRRDALNYLRTNTIGPKLALRDAQSHVGYIFEHQGEYYQLEEKDICEEYYHALEKKNKDIYIHHTAVLLAKVHSLLKVPKQKMQKKKNKKEIKEEEKVTFFGYEPQKCLHLTEALATNNHDFINERIKTLLNYQWLRMPKVVSAGVNIKEMRINSQTNRLQKITVKNDVADSLTRAEDIAEYLFTLFEQNTFSVEQMSTFFSYYQAESKRPLTDDEILAILDLLVMRMIIAMVEEGNLRINSSLEKLLEYIRDKENQRQLLAVEKVDIAQFIWHETSTINDLMEAFKLYESPLPGNYMRLLIYGNTLALDTVNDFYVLPMNVSDEIRDWAESNGICSLVFNPKMDKNKEALYEFTYQLTDVLRTGGEDLIDFVRKNSEKINIEVDLVHEELAKEEGFISQRENIESYARYMIETEGELVATAHQPGYLRWAPFYNTLLQGKFHFLYDHVQFTREDGFQHRQQLRLPTKHEKQEWLSTPLISGEGEHELISAKKLNVDSPIWKTEHLVAFVDTYGNTPYFANYFAELEEMYTHTWRALGDINEAMLRFMARKMGYKGYMIRQSSLGVDPSEYAKARLIAHTFNRAFEGIKEKSKRNIHYLSALGAMKFYLYTPDEFSEKDMTLKRDILYNEGFGLRFIRPYRPGGWPQAQYSHIDGFNFYYGPALDLLANVESEEEINSYLQTAYEPEWEKLCRLYEKSGATLPVSLSVCNKSESQMRTLLNWAHKNDITEDLLTRLVFNRLLFIKGAPEESRKILDISSEQWHALSDYYEGILYDVPVFTHEEIVEQLESAVKNIVDSSLNLDQRRLSLDMLLYALKEYPSFANQILQKDNSFKEIINFIIEKERNIFDEITGEVMLADSETKIKTLVELSNVEDNSAVPDHIIDIVFHFAAREDDIDIRKMALVLLKEYEDERTIAAARWSLEHENRSMRDFAKNILVEMNAYDSDCRYMYGISELLDKNPARRLRALKDLSEIAEDPEFHYRRNAVYRFIKALRLNDSDKRIRELARECLKNEYPNTRVVTYDFPEDGKKTVLITGGVGFIGKNYCRMLLERGYRVIALDNEWKGKTEYTRHLFDHPDFHFIQHDITIPIRIEGVRLDQVINLAAIVTPKLVLGAPQETLDVNYDGTKYSLDIALEHDAMYVISSTSEIYGPKPDVHPQPETYEGRVGTLEPRACYDEGKRVAETLTAAYHDDYGVRIRIIRFFNIYGPEMLPHDGRVITEFINQSLDGKQLTVFGDGSQTRTFCTARDLIKGIMGIVAYEIDEEQEPAAYVYNIGGNGDEVSIRELAIMVRVLVARYLGKEITPEEAEKQITFLESHSKDDPLFRKADATKVHSAIGWEQKDSLEDGIMSLIDFVVKTRQQADSPSKGGLNAVGRRVDLKKIRQLRHQVKMGLANFSLRSRNNGVTDNVYPDEKTCIIDGLAYEIDSPRSITDSVDTLATIKAKTAYPTIVIRGPNSKEHIAEYVAKNPSLIYQAIERSSMMHDGDLPETITIVIADKYDLIAGDYRDNNLIILNGSDIDTMLERQEERIFIDEFLVSILAEECAHERGARNGIDVEERLARQAAFNTLRALRNNDFNVSIVAYLAFLKRYTKSVGYMDTYITFIQNDMNVEESSNEQTWDVITDVIGLTQMKPLKAIESSTFKMGMSGWKRKPIQQWHDVGIVDEIKGAVIMSNGYDKSMRLWKHAENSKEKDRDFCIVVDDHIIADEGAIRTLSDELSKEPKAAVASAYLKPDAASVGSRAKAIIKGGLATFAIPILWLYGWFFYAVALFMGKGHTSRVIFQMQFAYTQDIMRRVFDAILGRHTKRNVVFPKQDVLDDPILDSWAKLFLQQHARWYTAVQQIYAKELRANEVDPTEIPESYEYKRQYESVSELLNDPRLSEGMKNAFRMVDPAHLSVWDGVSAMMMDIEYIGKISEHDTEVGGVNPDHPVFLPGSQMLLLPNGDKYRLIMPERITKGQKLNAWQNFMDGYFTLHLEVLTKEGDKKNVVLKFADLMKETNVLKDSKAVVQKKNVTTVYPKVAEDAKQKAERQHKDEKRIATKAYHALMQYFGKGKIEYGASTITMPVSVGFVWAPAKWRNVISRLSFGVFDVFLFQRLRLWLGTIGRGPKQYASMIAAYDEKEVRERVEKIMRMPKAKAYQNLKRKYEQLMRMYGKQTVAERLGVQPDQDSIMFALGLLNEAGEAMAAGDPIAGFLSYGAKHPGDAARPFGLMAEYENALYVRATTYWNDYGQDTSWLFGSEAALRSGPARLNSYLLSALPESIAVSVRDNVEELIEKIKESGYLLDSLYVLPNTKDNTYRIVVVTPSADRYITRNGNKVSLCLPNEQEASQGISYYDKRVKLFAKACKRSINELEYVMVLTPQEHSMLIGSDPRIMQIARERSIPDIAHNALAQKLRQHLLEAKRKKTIIKRISPIDAFFMQTEERKMSDWLVSSSFIQPSVRQVNNLYEKMSKEWIQKLHNALKEKGEKGFSLYARKTGRVALNSRDYKRLNELFGAKGQNVDLFDKTKWHTVFGIPLPGFPMLFTAVIPWKRPWFDVQPATVNALLLRQRLAEGRTSSVLGPSSLQEPLTSMSEDLAMGVSMRTEAYEPVGHSFSMVRRGRLEEMRRHSQNDVMDALGNVQYKGIMRARADMHSNPYDAAILNNFTAFLDNQYGLDSIAPPTDTTGRHWGVFEMLMFQTTLQDPRRHLDGMFFYGAKKAYWDNRVYYNINGFDRAHDLIRLMHGDNKERSVLSPRIAAAIALTYSEDLLRETIDTVEAVFNKYPKRYRLFITEHSLPFDIWDKVYAAYKRANTKEIDRFAAALDRTREVIIENVRSAKSHSDIVKLMKRARIQDYVRRVEAKLTSKPLREKIASRYIMVSSWLGTIAMLAYLTYQFWFAIDSEPVLSVLAVGVFMMAGMSVMILYPVLGGILGLITLELINPKKIRTNCMRLILVSAMIGFLHVADITRLQTSRGISVVTRTVDAYTNTIPRIDATKIVVKAIPTQEAQKYDVAEEKPSDLAHMEEMKSKIKPHIIEPVQKPLVIKRVKAPMHATFQPAGQLVSIEERFSPINMYTGNIIEDAKEAFGMPVRALVKHPGIFQRTARKAVVISHPENVEFSLKEGDVFYVINESRDVVYSGYLPAKQNDSINEENSYYLDITNFDLNGSFTFVLPVGEDLICTQFEVKDELFAQLSETIFSTFDLLRYKDFTVPREVKIYGDTYGNVDKKRWKYVSTPQGTFVDGSFGTLMTTELAFVSQLAFQLEHGTFADGTVTRDKVLKEFKYHLNFLLQMQSEHTGGMYWAIGPYYYPKEYSKLRDHQRWYLYGGYTTPQTAYAAKLFFDGARQFRNENPDFAQTLFDAGMRCWEYLRHQAQTVNYKRPKDRDNFELLISDYEDDDTEKRIAAAVSLLKFLYESGSHKEDIESVREYISDKAKYLEPSPYMHVNYDSYVLFDIVQLPSEMLDRPKVQAEAKKKIIAYAEQLLRTVQSDAYRLAADQEARESWGSVEYIAQDAMALLMAYKITNEVRYLDTAELQLFYLLGANPYGRSFATQIGLDAPLESYSALFNANFNGKPHPRGWWLGGPNVVLDEKGRTGPYERMQFVDPSEEGKPDSMSGRYFSMEGGLQTQGSLWSLARTIASMRDERKTQTIEERIEDTEYAVENEKELSKRTVAIPLATGIAVSAAVPTLLRTGMNWAEGSNKNVLINVNELASVETAKAAYVAQQIRWRINDLPHESISVDIFNKGSQLTALVHELEVVLKRKGFIASMDELRENEVLAPYVDLFIEYGIVANKEIIMAYKRNGRQYMEVYGIPIIFSGSLTKHKEVEEFIIERLKDNREKLGSLYLMLKEKNGYIEIGKDLREDLESNGVVYIAEKIVRDLVYVPESRKQEFEYEMHTEIFDSLYIEKGLWYESSIVNNITDEILEYVISDVGDDLKYARRLVSLTYWRWIKYLITMKYKKPSDMHRNITKTISFAELQRIVPRLKVMNMQGEIESYAMLAFVYACIEVNEMTHIVHGKRAFGDFKKMDNDAVEALWHSFKKVFTCLDETRTSHRFKNTLYARVYKHIAQVLYDGDSKRAEKVLLSLKEKNSRKINSYIKNHNRVPTLTVYVDPEIRWSNAFGHLQILFESFREKGIHIVYTDEYAKASEVDLILTYRDNNRKAFVKEKTYLFDRDENRFVVQTAILGEIVEVLLHRFFDEEKGIGIISLQAISRSLLSVENQGFAVADAIITELVNDSIVKEMQTKAIKVAA